MLCSLLCAGLAFAGGDSESETAAPTSKATGVQLSESEIFAKYSPEITLTFGGREPVGVKYVDGENYENNRWIDLLREELGINLEYEWVVSTSQYAEKVNVIIASGDIPDAMSHISSLQLAKLVDAEMVNMDLENVYKSYVSPTLAIDMSHPGSEGTFGAATYGGKLAAIPYPFSALGQGARTLVMRSDWMNDLGLTPPKTHEEMYEIFDTMIEETSAEIALVTNKDLAWLDPFFWSFGAYPKNWIDDGTGKLVYGSAQPEIKEALRALNFMYNEGYLDPEFAAKDGTKAMEMLTSGKAIGNFDGWEPGSARNMVEADPSIDFQTYHLPSPDGTPVMQIHPSFGNNFYVIRDDYQYPEAVMKMISYLTEETYGPNATGEFYVEYIQDFDLGIAPFTWGPWFCISVEKNYTTYKKLKTNTPYGSLNAEEQWIADTIDKWEAGDAKQWWMAKFFNPPTSHYRILDDVLANGWYFADAFYGAPLVSMVDNKSTVDRIYLEMAIKMIVGQESLDNFDDYVEQMNRAGLSEMTADVNSWAAAR